MSTACHVLLSTGDPTEAPPRSGLHWVNTTTNAHYLSIGVSTVLDWVTFPAVQATETLKGIAELATQAETNAGVDDLRIVTPLKMKVFVDNEVAGLYDNKGAYNASTNTPDLDVSPSGISKGDAYTVSVAGDFFTEAMEAGDVLIADQDNPTLLSHWIRVQRNIDQATETVVGFAELATQAETDAGVDDLRIVTPLKLANFSGMGGTSMQLNTFLSIAATRPSNNAASFGDRNGHSIVEFDDSVGEQILWSHVMNQDYTGGDILVDLFWFAQTATAGNVTWGVEIERGEVGVLDVDVDNFASQQEGTSATNGTNGLLNITTVTLTNAQADAIVAGEYFRLRVHRGDLTGDTMADDAQLVAVNFRQSS